jgi:hypothetical protein
MASLRIPQEWFDCRTGLASFRAFAHGKPSCMLNYSWMILPDARCLAGDEIAAVKSDADSGRFLATTLETGHYDDTGARRRRNRFGETLGTRVHQENAGAGFANNLLGGEKLEPAIQIEASPLVYTQPASVGGRPDIFLANFNGLQPNRKLTQTPQTGGRVSFPADGPRKIRVLPFPVSGQDLPATWNNSRLCCTLPAIDKGMVVWMECQLRSASVLQSLDAHTTRYRTGSVPYWSAGSSTVLYAGASNLRAISR